MFGARPFGTRGLGDSAGFAGVLYTFTVVVDDSRHAHRSTPALFPNPEYSSGGFGVRPFGTRGFGDNAGGVPVSAVYPASIPPGGVGVPRLWSMLEIARPVTLFGEIQLSIRPSGIPSGEGLGSPIVADDRYVLPLGIDPGAMGGPPELIDKFVVAGAVTLFGEIAVMILPAGIPPGGVGAPILADEQYVLPEGIPSAEAFGEAGVFNKGRLAGAVTLFGEADAAVVSHILPPSIPTSTVFPSPRVLHAYQVIIDEGTGIPSQEAFGVPRLIPSLQPSPACLGEQPTARYVPVTVGSPRFLCGTGMPNGKGLLTWCDGATLRSAVFDDPADWLQNGVITSLAQTSTVLSVANTVFASACFTNGTDVFVTALWRDNRNYGYQVFKADDPNTCTTFSLYSTLWAGPVPGPHPVDEEIIDNYVGQKQACIPFISGNTWLLPGPFFYWWLNPAPPAPDPKHRVYARVAMWHSVDGGASFTLRVNYGYYDIFLAPPYFTEYIGPQVGIHPDTRALYWTSGGTPDVYHWWESLDGGNGWTGHDAFPSSARRNSIPFTDCGDDLFITQPATGQVYTVDKVGSSFVTTSYPIQWIGPYDLNQTKLAIVRPPMDLDPLHASIYCFIKDSVQGVPVDIAQGGWIVGLTAGKTVVSGWQ